MTQADQVREAEAVREMKKEKMTYRKLANWWKKHKDEVAKQP